MTIVDWLREYLHHTTEHFPLKTAIINKEFTSSLQNYVIFESQGRKKSIVTHNHIDWLYVKMSELRQQLETYPQFVSSHRAYIVNVNHVVRIDGFDLVMANKQLIAVKSDDRQKIEQMKLDLF